VLLRTFAKSRALEGTKNRDRSIDAIRALCLSLVVLGHAVMGMVYWGDSQIVLGNLLAIDSRLHWVTWIFQIMPVFFIAGGAANSLSMKSKEITYSLWLWKRISRLLSPTLTYLAIMLSVGWVLGNFFSDAFMQIYLLMVTQLLWFLGVYIICTALFPVMLRLPRLGSVIGLLLAVIVVDIARFQWNETIGILNFLFVWLLIMVLGTLFVAPLSNTLNLVFVVLLLATELVLVSRDIYPVSLVGLPTEEFSNVAPPSVLIALHGMLFLFMLSLLKPLINRVCEHTRVWAMVVSINAGAMTVYLWHIPMIMFVALSLYSLDVSPNTVLVANIVMPGDGFWPSTLLYWALALFCVYFFVQIIWPLEHVKLPIWDSLPTEHKVWWRTLLASMSVMLSGFGLLGLAGSGLFGFPGKLVSFAGFSYTNGFALMLFLAGLLTLKLSVADYSAKSPR
jgi:hypothetical protein